MVVTYFKSRIEKEYVFNLASLIKEDSILDGLLTKEDYQEVQKTETKTKSRKQIYNHRITRCNKIIR